MKKSNIKHILISLGVLFTFLTGPAVVSSEQSSEPKQKEAQKVEKKEQEKQKKDKEQEVPVLEYEINVTATRTEKETYRTPNPVSVVTKKEIKEKAPNTVSDLFTEIPGMDVTGVGTNQTRPIIRGLRGQRILLLEDGIRMNNSRRQQDFGEIPGLVDVSEVEKVEVVRGPASVLYGSDAIGGVVNIITNSPDYNKEKSEIHGSLGYRYSSADNQHKGVFNLNGNLGKLGFQLSGTYRKAADYTAPAGTFGNITLTEDSTVRDSGVKDNSLNLFLGYRFSGQNNLSMKYEYYNAKDAGFGYINPADYAPGDPAIQILYPHQNVQKLTLNYNNRGLFFLLADGVDFTAYHLKNTRLLNMNIFVPFNIPWFKDAGMKMETSNDTDIRTSGFRLEFTKVIFNNQILKYGADFFQDSTENTDSISIEIVGFGPSLPQVNTTPEVPNASFRSAGLFIQDDISIFSRTSLILGMRYQNIKAKTKTTPGLEDVPLISSTDDTVVGAANFMHGLTDNLKVFVSVGRAFRSPNLIERFFNGPTPEGRGYQSPNTSLKAETSLNVDLGIKYRSQHFSFESSVFRNTIYDGIRVVPTGNVVFGFPEYKNVNIDKLLLKGVELQGQVSLDFGLSFLANYTHITAKDLVNPDFYYTNTFASKINFNIHYEDPQGLFWLDYLIRHNGNQKDVELVSNPIGDMIPGFTVHTLSGGITLFKRNPAPQHLGIIIGNLTNALYAEFSNASFFRPAPKRFVALTWSTGF